MKIGYFMKIMLFKANGKRAGQGFVELLLVIPVLTILLAGAVEFGYLLNQYVDLVDGAREGARFGSDIDPFKSDGSIDTEFYSAIVQISETALAPINLDPVAGDDIVISFFSVENGVATRYPSEPGWSSYGNQVSKFSSEEIEAHLISDAPNSGILLVEVFYNYNQILKMFSLGGVPDPIPVYVYSIMPLSAAEPISQNYFKNQLILDLKSNFQNKKDLYELIQLHPPSPVWFSHEDS